MVWDRRRGFGSWYDQTMLAFAADLPGPVEPKLVFSFISFSGRKKYLIIVRVEQKGIDVGCVASGHNWTLYFSAGLAPECSCIPAPAAQVRRKWLQGTVRVLCPTISLCTPALPCHRPLPQHQFLDAWSGANAITRSATSV